MEQRPDLDREPSNGARVEDDFIKPLRPAKGIGHRRLPAALPFALAGILVVSSVAFGATVVRSLVATPSSTPVVVGDDDPSPDPTIEITEAPPTEAPATEAPATQEPTAEPTAEPSQGPAEHVLTLVSTRDGGKVKLEWSRYTGEDFAYYKVVRSTNEEVSWPLGDGDKLVAAISEIDQLSFTDCPPAGTTVFYQVFAVKSSDSGYEVLADSNVVTQVIPAATPKPTANCSIHLNASFEAPAAALTPNVVASGVSFSWNKWLCGWGNGWYYGVVRNETGNPTLPLGSVPGSFYTDNVNQLTGNDWQGVEPGHTYYYRVYVFNDNTNAVVDGVAPACNANTIIAYSNVVKVVIPAAPEGSPTV
jgi:hypothetical protein